MKFKKIVGFGDSWMWGDELLDPALKNLPDAHPVQIENLVYRESHCFLGLLGKHYGVPVENFGIPGGSLQSSIWTYLWWLENEVSDTQDCLVLVSLTCADRQSFYNPKHISYINDPPWNRFIHSVWVHSGTNSINSEWQTMVKQHTVLTDCVKFRQLNYRQSVLFFAGQKCSTAATVQFNSMKPCMKLDDPTLLWSSGGLTDILLERPNYLDLIAPQRHPNEKGHEIIRDMLIPEIDKLF